MIGVYTRLEVGVGGGGGGILRTPFTQPIGSFVQILALDMTYAADLALKTKLTYLGLSTIIIMHKTENFPEKIHIR